jgi:tetratricopeptide (TPR) repeat protein
MSFENLYHLLWLLALLPAGALLYTAIRWKRQLKEKLGDSRLVANLFAGYSPARFLWKGVLVLAAITCLALALANLRRPDSSEKVKLSGTDLMIALDVSNSMLATDIQPSRLEKAKLLIGKLIDKLQGNRIGLVVFAGNAYLQMPLTTDASAVRLFLSTISPNIVPYQGTNISEALQVCNRSLNTQEKKYKSILLISDGEDHDQGTEKTAEQLKSDGVVINTVGIGSPQGSTLFDPNTNQLRRDEQGNAVISKLNEADLQKIASLTNGAYTLLSNADDAANTIAQELATMDQKPITDTTLTNFTSYYEWFVLLAVVALLAELLLTEQKKKGLKMKGATLSLFLIGASVPGFSQKEVKQVRSGNEAYRKQNFEQAGKDYQAALKVNGGSKAAAFNLGNTLYKSGKYDEATQQYEGLRGGAEDKRLQAQTLYNKGLSQVRQQKLDEAIQSFKQSLRLNPADEETRENLQKALNEKKQQEQQQQKQQQKQDEDKKDDQKKDKKEQKQPNDPKQDQQPQQPQPKINKQDAEQKLQALRQEEKKLQQKLSDRQPANRRQPEKDW